MLTKRYEYVVKFATNEDKYQEIKEAVEKITEGNSYIDIQVKKTFSEITIDVPWFDK